jgi:hypothetical protein
MIHYLAREVWKATMTIHKGINEMRRIVVNTPLNLYHGGLQEVGEVERLEVTLTEDEIIYCGNIRDVGSSTSVPGSSASVLDPSISWGDISSPHTCMNVIDLSSSWMSWGDASDSSTSCEDY